MKYRKFKKALAVFVTVSLFIGMISTMIVSASAYRPRARIWYDCVIEDTHTHNSLWVSYMNAVVPFSAEFGIVFNVSPVTMTRSVLLNGGQHLFAFGRCRRPNNQTCAASCGALSNCDRNHHRNDDRLLDTHGVSTTDYVIRVVGHALCYWQDNAHRRSGGLADVRGRDSLVSTEAWGTPLSIVMQHELSHNLGATHTTCWDILCVLVSVRNSWCPPCRHSIRTHTGT